MQIKTQTTTTVVSAGGRELVSITTNHVLHAGDNESFWPESAETAQKVAGRIHVQTVVGALAATNTKEGK